MKNRNLSIENLVTALLATAVLGLIAALIAAVNLWNGVAGNDLLTTVLGLGCALTAWRMGWATYGLLQSPCINFGDNEPKPATKREPSPAELLDKAHRQYERGLINQAELDKACQRWA